jgi:hypothetical protein
MLSSVSVHHGTKCTRLDAIGNGSPKCSTMDEFLYAMIRNLGSGCNMQLLF